MNDVERLKLALVGNDDDAIWAEMEEIAERWHGVAGHAYYDRAGNPINYREWITLRHYDRENGNKYTIVGRTKVGDSAVSTVWLGLDHGIPLDDDPDYRPIIFETMIFGGPGDDEQWRYSSLEEAIEGHDRVVEQLRVFEQLDQ